MSAWVERVGWVLGASLLVYGCQGAERRPQYQEADLEDPVAQPTPSTEAPYTPPPLQPIEDGGTPDAPVQACAGTSVKAELATLPADIIWIVDNSNSMRDEIDAVRAGINAFAAQLAASSIDYHLVMLSQRGSTENGKLHPICVPEPLAGPDCGDSNRFLHANFAKDGIKSVQPLEQLLGSLGQTQGYTSGETRGSTPWRQHLRAEASKTIVVVSDDNARLSANAFLNTNGGQVSTLVSGGSSNCFIPPGLKRPHWEGLFDRLVVHAMVAPTGNTYIDLADQTGGLVADINEAGGPSSPGWTQFFTAVAHEVVTAANVSCTLPVPAPPPGETLDPNRVNVAISSVSDASGKHTLGRVTGADQCESGGWYYDNTDAPTEIRLCQSSCDEMNGAADDVRGADVVFGCATQIR